MNDMVLPLFSVIVPVYNSEKYLPACIECVLNQSFENYELILVNDGSIDKSEQICSKYAAGDSRVKLINKQNGGHTSARNAGLKASTGEYVLFLDSDDTLDSDTLCECKKAVGCDSPDIIIFGYRKLSEDNTHEYTDKLSQGFYNRKKIESEIFPRLIMPEDGYMLSRSLCNKAWKRELIIKYQLCIPENIQTGEDMCCVITTVLNSQSVYVIDKIFYNYFIYGTSTSHVSDLDSCNKCSVLLNFLDKRIPDSNNGLRLQLNRLAVQQAYSAALRVMRGNGKRTEKKSGCIQLFQQPICVSAIKNAHFTDKKLIIKRFILRHKLFFAMSMLDNIIH